MESTALEALTAELLGDVGELHDKIKELPRELQGAVDPSINALERLAAEITAAANGLRVRISDDDLKTLGANIAKALPPPTQNVKPDWSVLTVPLREAFSWWYVVGLCAFIILGALGWAKGVSYEFDRGYSQGLVACTKVEPGALKKNGSAQ
ncbi:uncharacterized protein E1O_02050 [Burkholderiales bacterium GJ-E10]|nr:uncharacterized protein E1O_02050 [Burkholderiales bacterium GJ-E10]